MKNKFIIVWFRQDLRLHNNPALTAAVQQHRPIVLVFIWSPEEEGNWAPGVSSRWWLHQSLKSLNTQLEEMNSRLILYTGPALEKLENLIRDIHACGVYCNRRYEPDVINHKEARDRALLAYDCIKKRKSC